MPRYPVNAVGQKSGRSGAFLADVFKTVRLRLTPSAAAANSVLAATAMPAAGTTVVTSGITQPDVPRNVSIVGSQAGIVGNVVIAGKNVNGQSMSETIVANGTATVVGNKAFASISSITIPVRNAGGDTIAVGRGSKIGLRHKLTHNTVLYAFLNNVKEGTPPTIATSSSLVESNTALLNSALPGAQPVDIYYLAQ